MPDNTAPLSPSDRLKLLGKLSKLVEDISERDRRWILDQLIELHATAEK